MLATCSCLFGFEWPQVQSDKATVEITSRYTGTITKLNFEVGDMVKVIGTVFDHFRICIFVFIDESFIQRGMI
jgi:hypothetical protein